jgi:uncharacterized protein with FMN-binding domain
VIGSHLFIFTNQNQASNTYKIMTHFSFIFKKPFCLTIAIIYVLISFSAFAQHISVLGIPIDGNITSFQKKLNAKGFKFNKDELENFADGIRYYNGSVQGHKTDLKVFFNRKTQLVYKVDVITHSNDENFIKRLFNKTTQSIEGKYAYKKSIINDITVKTKYSIVSTICLGMEMA